jgi:hypothetical protein
VQTGPELSRTPGLRGGKVVLFTGIVARAVKLDKFVLGLISFGQNGPLRSCMAARWTKLNTVVNLPASKRRCYE